MAGMTANANSLFGDGMNFTKFRKNVGQTFMARELIYIVSVCFFIHTLPILCIEQMRHFGAPDPAIKPVLSH